MPHFVLRVRLFHPEMVGMGPDAVPFSDDTRVMEFPDAEAAHAFAMGIASQPIVVEALVVGITDKEFVVGVGGFTRDRALTKAAVAAKEAERDKDKEAK